MAHNQQTPEDELKTPQASPEPELPQTPATQQKSSKRAFDVKAFIRTKKGKIVLAIAAVVVVIGLVFAIPASRYAVAGLVIKKDVTVQALDSKTNKPVTAALVTLAGQTVKSDKDGKAIFHNVPVGQYKASVKKTYYQDNTVDALVPILSNAHTATVNLVATGRQVPVALANKISGQPLANVEVTAENSTVTTADDGTATIVLPADRTTVSASFKLANYNTATADITVTEQTDAKNSFGLTPAGKIYFLSKRTGKIDVMKSDLDGANATVVVPGTGRESNTQTVLLASRDWKYVALQATRDTDKAKLYLLNTADDKLTVMDEGANVDFTPVGWSNDTFIYQVVRPDVPDWQAKRQSIKSFNASTAKIATLDDTDGLGSNITTWAHESYSRIYIVDDGIVYAKQWDSYYYSPALIDGKKDGMYKVKSSGESKQTLKDFAATTSSYIDATAYKPSEVYFRVSGSPSKFYEYEDGSVTETNAVNDDTYYNQNYATYLISPSGSNTFWSEPRDGKNVSFIGDKEGANGKQILADNDYVPYGWYSDDYLLLSKKGSELYVLPRTNTKNAQPLKVTDYHKPAITFPGYGYGYGGGF